MNFKKLLSLGLCAASVSAFAENTKTVDLYVKYHKTICVSESSDSENGGERKTTCVSEGDSSDDNNPKKITLTEVPEAGGSYQGTFQTSGPALLTINDNTTSEYVSVSLNYPQDPALTAFSIADLSFADISLGNSLRITQTDNADASTTFVLEQTMFAGTRVAGAFERAATVSTQKFKADILKKQSVLK